MKENNCGVEEAVRELVFISNNDSNYKKAEIDWLKELYPFLKELDKEDLEKAKETFFIEEREEKILKEKDEKIENIKRQLLLFEFSEVIDSWSKDELKEIMELYDITDKEKETIVLDLYTPFKDKLIDVTKDIKKISDLNKIVLDKEVSIDTLNDEDKNYVDEKRQLLSKLIDDNLVDEIGTHK